MKYLEGKYFRFYFPKDISDCLKCTPHPIRSFANPSDYERYNGRIAEVLPVPLFLCVPQGSAPQKLEYPILPNYQRLGSKIIISPRELSFSEKVHLLLEEESGVVSFPLNRKQSTSIYLKKNLKSVILEQSDGTWVLEERRQIYDVPEKITSYTFESLLSLKALLDPNKGFERLLEDIETGKFKTNQRERLTRLLQILRVAQEKEETTILANLREQDPIFYQAVIQELFSESILPYMNRNEVTKILYAIPEIDLRRAFSDRNQVNLYAPYFSRNRMADLVRYAIPQESVSLWQRILNHFRQRASLYLPILERHYPFYKMLDYEANLTKEMSCEYASSAKNIRILLFRQGKLWVQTERFFAQLWLFVETSQGSFRRYFFRDVLAGLIILDDLALRPRLVFAAGVTASENCEVIAVDLR